jgi:hypothetical protein
MTRQQLIERSESFLREFLQDNLAPDTPVYLFGSRSLQILQLNWR